MGDVDDAMVLGAVVEAQRELSTKSSGCDGSGREAVGDAAEKEPRGSSGRRSQDATGAVGRLLVLQPRRSSSRICGRAGVSL